MIRILIADDHTIVRRELIRILPEEYPTVAIGEAGNARQFIHKVLNERMECSNLRFVYAELQQLRCSLSNQTIFSLLTDAYHGHAPGTSIFNVGFKSLCFGIFQQSLTNGPSWTTIISFLYLAKEPDNNTIIH